MRRTLPVLILALSLAGCASVQARYVVDARQAGAVSSAKANDCGAALTLALAGVPRNERPAIIGLDDSKPFLRGTGYLLTLAGIATATAAAFVTSEDERNVVVAIGGASTLVGLGFQAAGDLAPACQALVRSTGPLTDRAR